MDKFDYRKTPICDSVYDDPALKSDSEVFTKISETAEHLERALRWMVKREVGKNEEEEIRIAMERTK